ncbi:MAG: hypothetical protein DRN53_08335 [Thermoprotei archaeon]|nr:MAG: hypothetical protein DRN53_08335 [Thermoprotei archaeon]
MSTGCDRKMRILKVIERDRVNLKKIVVMLSILFISLILISSITHLNPPEPKLITGLAMIGVGTILVIYTILSKEKRLFSIWSSIAMVSGTYLVLKNANPILFLGILALFIFVTNILIPREKVHASLTK